MKIYLTDLDPTYPAGMLIWGCVTAVGLIVWGIVTLFS